MKRLAAPGADDAFATAANAIQESITSIVDDKELEPGATLKMLTATINEYEAHIRKHVPDRMADACAHVERVLSKALNREDPVPDFAGLEQELTAAADNPGLDHAVAIANIVRQFEGRFPDLSKEQAAKGKQIMEAALARAKANNQQRATILLPKLQKDADMTQFTRQDCYEAIDGIAKRVRQSGEIHAQAYERVLKTDPLARKMYNESANLPLADADNGPRAEMVTKRVAQVVVASDINAKASEMRKRDPSMTLDRAYTQIYREMNAA